MSTRISNLTASALIVALTLGSGITSMPAVFNMLGSVKGFLMMGVMGLVTFHSIYCLSYAATLAKEKHDDELSYTSLAAKFSKNLERCVALSLIVSVLSTAFSFIQRLVNISIDLLKTNGTVEAFFKENNGNVQYYLFRFAFMAVLCTVYYLLFLLDSLSSLAIFSNFSLFAAVLFSAVISYYGIAKPVDPSQLTTEHHDLGCALGNVVFAIHCQFSFLSVFNSLKDISLPNVRLVTITGSAMATIMYSAVGFLGYRGLGSDIGNKSVLSIFSLNFSDLDEKSSEFKVLNSLRERYGEFVGITLPKALCFMFIPIFFVGVVSSMFSIIPTMQNMLSRKGKQPSRRKMSMLCCALVFLFGAYNVESLDKILAIFGYLLTTPLSFLFPSLFVLYTTKKVSLLTISSAAMIVLSCALMIGLSIIELRAPKQVK